MKKCISKGKVTLRDIALKTGFSVNTVSHAIKGIDDVKPETKKVILEAAERLGYIPNLTAVSMRSGKTHTVAVIIPDISSLFFPIMVKMLEEELRKKGYTIIIMNTNENEEQEKECIIAAIAKSVDGVIICPTQDSQKGLELLKRHQIPFVLMGRSLFDGEYEAVLADDYRCGYIAADYLLKMGHRKILYLTVPLAVSSVAERKAGYLMAMEKAGATVNENLMRIWDKETAEDIADSIKSKKLDCTAIFAFNDMLAFEVATLLLERGLRIPEDISLIGVDNIQSHMMLPLRLTTIEASKKHMVNNIIDSLMGMIQGTARIFSKHLLSPELIIRDTVKSLNKEL